MQLTIQKQKGLTHGMTFHTEFHRPQTKMKGGVAVVGVAFLFGVCETLYEMSCHVENPYVFL